MSEEESPFHKERVLYEVLGGPHISKDLLEHRRIAYNNLMEKGFPEKECIAAARQIVHINKK